MKDKTNRASEVLPKNREDAEVNLPKPTPHGTRFHQGRATGTGQDG